ncbi:MAG: type II toxin-antitoxin system HicB family antitoxin [Lachnospiraceae bacterium]|nr:type II toxin-antitoxin system HicB family antitoxin [Lachnospiraceae bacterium]
MKKDTYVYPAIIGKEKNEKEYSVFFPDLDVAKSGVNEEDALLSARELLGVVIYGLEQDKEKIPKPSELSRIKYGNNERTLLVDVYMPSVRMAENSKAVNRTVTLPAWLNSLATAKKFNFSLTLQEALKKKLKIAN